MILMALAVLLTSCVGGGGGNEGEEGGADQSASAPSAPAGDVATAPAGASGSEGQGTAGNALRKTVAILFASGEDDLLHPQKRNIFWTARVEDRAKQVLAELIEGPSEGGLAVLPPEVLVREFYLLADGTAFVDFSKEILNGSGGSESELSTIYAIVDTLALDFPEIQRVGILVNGEEAESLAGHIDLRYPIQPDPRYLEPGAADALREIMQKSSPATI